MIGRAIRVLRSPSLQTFAVAFGLLTVLTVLWSLATPVFASPDENAHAVKAIAQWNGQLLGHEREGVRFPVYDLPDGYRYSPQTVCFAFQPDAHAACGVELGAAEGTTWFGSWVSAYNPVYYYLVGWPSHFVSGSAGIYAMRIVSAALCSALLALAVVAALASSRRRWMPLALGFLAAPMILFLNGSVNPQGMEYSAGALLLIALLRLLERQVGDPSGVLLSNRVLWGLVVTGASLLAVGRALGPLWVLVIVAGGLAASGSRAAGALFRNRASYPPIAVTAVVGIFAVSWTLAAGNVSSQATESDAPLVGGTFAEGAWAMLSHTPVFIQQVLGDFGWLDTTLPTAMYFPIVAALAVLVILGAVAPDLRGRITTMAAVGVAVALPTLIQAVQVSRTGLIWQGRYSLVLYLGVVILAAWALSRSPSPVDSISVRTTIVGATLVSGFSFAAFVIVLRRYVVGEARTFTDMISTPIWQPPGGWPLLVAAMLVVLTLYTVWLTVLVRRAAALDVIASERAPVV